MGQVAHLVTRFGESLVVFGASLDGSRLASAGAMGKEIARDGEEHFIEEGCHGFGFILGPLSRVGELAHGVQAALEERRSLTCPLIKGTRGRYFVVPWVGEFGIALGGGGASMRG